MAKSRENSSIGARRSGAGRAVLLLGLALVPVGCGPEHEVLTSPSSAEGSAGVAGGPSVPTGSGGATSDVGGNTSTGGGSTVDGGESASGGASQGGTGPASLACGAHLDCAAGQTCLGGECSPCSDSAIDCSAACPAQQVRVATIRNGCAICECAPLSECNGDYNCPEGEVCYRAAQCDEGCETFDCCYGNYCGAPGCPGPPPSCTLSGCEGGGVCQPSCAESMCECSGTLWSCFDPATGTGGSAGAGAGGIGGNTCQGQCVPP